MYKTDQADQLGSEDTAIAPESNVINLTTMVSDDLAKLGRDTKDGFTDVC